VLYDTDQNPTFRSASTRRAAAQVRQVSHAQTLGDFSQPGPAGGEETAQQPAFGQLLQPHGRISWDDPHNLTLRARRVNILSLSFPTGTPQDWETEEVWIEFLAVGFFFLHPESKELH